MKRNLRQDATLNSIQIDAAKKQHTHCDDMS